MFGSFLEYLTKRQRYKLRYVIEWCYLRCFCFKKRDKNS